MCFLFSWLLLSHVFVHDFIRLFDFIVINGVNLMTKSTSVFQQPNSSQNQSLVFFHMYVSYVPLNQTRFCLLLLMTLIICLSVLCITQANNTHRHIHENHEIFFCCVCFFHFFSSFLLSFFSLLFFSFFLLKKTSIKGVRDGDIN